MMINEKTFEIMSDITTTNMSGVTTMDATMWIFGVIPAISGLLLTINRALAIRNPYTEKNKPFECGFLSFLWQNRVQFSIAFFIFALLYLLFDLEVLLVFPYFLSSYTNEILGLITIVLFLLILVIGFIFELGKKALIINSKQLSLMHYDGKSENNSPAVQHAYIHNIILIMFLIILISGINISDNPLLHDTYINEAHRIICFHIVTILILIITLTIITLLISLISFDKKSKLHIKNLFHDLYCKVYFTLMDKNYNINSLMNFIAVLLVYMTLWIIMPFNGDDYGIQFFKNFDIKKSLDCIMYLYDYINLEFLNNINLGNNLELLRNFPKLLSNLSFGSIHLYDIVYGIYEGWLQHQTLGAGGASTWSEANSQKPIRSLVFCMNASESGNNAGSSSGSGNNAGSSSRSGDDVDTRPSFHDHYSPAYLAHLLDPSPSDDESSSESSSESGSETMPIDIYRPTPANIGRFNLSEVAKGRAYIDPGYIGWYKFSRTNGNPALPQNMYRQWPDIYGREYLHLNYHLSETLRIIETRNSIDKPSTYYPNRIKKLVMDMSNILISNLLGEEDKWRMACNRQRLIDIHSGLSVKWASGENGPYLTPKYKHCLQINQMIADSKLCDHELYARIAYRNTQINSLMWEEGEDAQNRRNQLHAENYRDGFYILSRNNQNSIASQNQNTVASSSQNSIASHIPPNIFRSN